MHILLCFHANSAVRLCKFHHASMKLLSCVHANSFGRPCKFLCASITVRFSCHWQYCILLEQEQRKDYKHSLHWGQVHLESVSSPLITNKWRQGCPSMAIVPFSDRDHIWLRPRHVLSSSGCNNTAKLKCKWMSKSNVPKKDMYFKCILIS